MQYLNLCRVRISLSGTREYIPVSSDKTSLFSTAMEGGSAGNAGACFRPTALKSKS